MTGEGRGRRWIIQDAIRDSRLPPLTRLLLHTLNNAADPDTGRIPYRFSPSLVDLRRWTGMREETFLNELNRAEERGWLVRERSKGGRTRRTRYTVVIPETGPPPGPVSDDGNRSVSGPVSADVNRSGSGPVSADVNRSASGPPVLDQRTRSLSPRARALDEALAERLPGASDEEREKLIRWIEEQNPRNPCPYLRGIPDADLRVKLKEIRRGGTHQGPGRGETREDPLAYRPEPDPPPVSDGPPAAPMAESIADVRAHLSSRRRPE